MEVKYKPHHSGNTPEARIASRLRNSGAGAKPNITTKHGESAQRVFHNIHTQAIRSRRARNPIRTPGGKS
jgi:hypothetical protein